MILLAGISGSLAARATETVNATSVGDNLLTRLAKREKIPVDSTVGRDSLDDELVIVGNDTISIILPQKNYGRYDRGLYNYLFIPRGQWSFGLTASYGEFSSDDFQVLSIIKDLDLNIKAYSLKPSISYTIRNNQAVGIKFNYTRMQGDLGGMSFDFSDDMNFTRRYQLLLTEFQRRIFLPQLCRTGAHETIWRIQ